MDFETKIKKLNGVYSKLLQELADTKKYGEDLQKELSTDFKDFWNVINASKRDLVRTDCEIVVAGEVSSGKTTLVNCLLGREFNDLLEVKLLASTGCITRIHNSEKHRVKILDKNEKQLRMMALENFKSFQEKELKTLREAYFVDAYLPVSLLKGHVILVDTPGIGETNQRDEMLLKFLPHAVAFIFVINARNAGGFADDRIGKILREVSAKTEDMPCFDRSDAMFLTNQWDSVEDALFRAEDKDKEVDEAWEIIKSQIMEKFDVPSSDNIFQISLREVYERKETKYKKEYDRFYEKLEKTIKENENKRVDFYLKYIKDFYGKAHEKNKARLRQSKTSEDGLKNQLKKTEKQIESIEGKMEQVKSNMIQCREDRVEELSNLLNNCLKGKKNVILNPKGEKRMNDVSFYNIPKEVFRRIDKYVGKWFETNKVKEIMSKANETFRIEAMKIVKEINVIARDLGVVTVVGIDPFVNNVHSVLTTRTIALSMAGGVVIGLGATVISASLAFGLVSGGVVATSLFILRKHIGIETRPWLEDMSYCKAMELVIAENIPEKYFGKEFDKKISSFCDTRIPQEIEKLEKVQKETESQIEKILSNRQLYEHLDKIFNNIEKNLKELKSM